MGGNKAYPVAGGHGYEGYKDSYIFDPATETYTKTNDMNDGHWYPSATVARQRRRASPSAGCARTRPAR